MKKLAYIITAFLFIGMSSCSKYEEGPSLSLRGKKARICGEWQLEKLTEDGVDITADYLLAIGSDTKFHIEKDGSYHVHGTLEDEGTWEFKDGKEEVMFKSNEAGAEEEHYTILKLKNNELWLKHVHDDGTLEFHYKQ